jgi:hypothetical protein
LLHAFVQKANMTMIEITHITKPDRHDIHDRIREVGAMLGSTVLWRLSLDDAIAATRLGEQFFVRRGGAQVPVERIEGGLLSAGAYLRTAPDFTGINNLLSLPELPAVNRLAQMLYGNRGFGQ